MNDQTKPRDSVLRMYPRERDSLDFLSRTLDVHASVLSVPFFGLPITNYLSSEASKCMYTREKAMPDAKDDGISLEGKSA